MDPRGRLPRKSTDAQVPDAAQKRYKGSSGMTVRDFPMRPNSAMGPFTEISVLMCRQVYLVLHQQR